MDPQQRRAHASCLRRAATAKSLVAARRAQYSYTVWVTQDKHARAFEVLWNDRSKQIIQKLNYSTDATDVRRYEQPHREPRCLACHSTEASRPAYGGLVSDGVGCESCHGPASAWLEEHTKVTWDLMGDGKYSQFGMKNTKNLVVRAQLCVGCHIGSPTKDGLPARDMNHDMVAAGHPRLNFEFAAFTATMPRHWGPERGEARDAAPEARIWAIGQIVAATASLKLLESRASGSVGSRGQQDRVDGPVAGVLRIRLLRLPPRFSSRQFSAGPRTNRRPGAYPWGTWYFPVVRLLAERKGKTEFVNSLDELAGEMAKPAPDAAAVARLARNANAELLPLVDLAGKTRYDRAEVEELLKTAKSLCTSDFPDWDAAAQAYLALVALCNGRRQAMETRGAPFPRNPQLGKALEAVRIKLAFPSGRRQKDWKYDSPRCFRPQDLKEPFHQVLNSLPEPER